MRACNRQWFVGLWQEALKCGWQCWPQHKVPCPWGLRLRWCPPDWDKGHDQRTSEDLFFMKARQDWKTRKCSPGKKCSPTMWHRGYHQNIFHSGCRHWSEDKLSNRLVRTLTCFTFEPFLSNLCLVSLSLHLLAWQKTRGRCWDGIFGFFHFLISVRHHEKQSTGMEHALDVSKSKWLKY